jgi:hypothetical protein
MVGQIHTIVRMETAFHNKNEGKNSLIFCEFLLMHSPRLQIKVELL